MTGRAVEVTVRNATQGEAWVDDVQNALKGMLDPEAAAKTDGVAESDEMKQLREKMVENAKVEFADGRAPDAPAGPGGRRGGADEQYGSFGGGGGGGGGDRACYNCGENGHMSRDCPQPRSQGGGGGGGGGDRYGGRDDEAYGSFGGGGGGGGGGDRDCYNCGKPGAHAAPVGGHNEDSLAATLNR